MNPNNRPDRIVFLIRSLGVGGAETQLVHLAIGLEELGFPVSVIAMYPGGPLESELRARKGFDYVMLGKGGKSDVARFGANLWREIRRRRPAIVHGYMPFGNQLALAVGRAAAAKVVWGIRSSFIDFRHYDASDRFLFATGRLLSRLPELIIVNSWAGREYHKNAGYHASKMIVIPNGIDSARFRPQPEAKSRLRREWGVPDGAPLVGIVGRVEYMKGHSTFLDAAQLVASHTDAHFVCIGNGSPPYKSDMEARSLAAGLGDRVHWVGVRDDMPSAYSALDVLVSASVGEGFSNVIGEAMASGVRCVVTDVGDSARIVEGAGLVVPPSDPPAMARAILDLVDADCKSLSDPRQQISKTFSRERMVDATASALRGLL